MSKEELPQLFEATPAHAKELDAIQGQGDAAYAQYMDNLAEQVIEAGGVCDETTFLRSFFAQCQRSEYHYSGGIVRELKPVLSFSRWLQSRAGSPVAKLVEDKYVSVPRVLAKPAGKIIGSGYAQTPVVTFDIERHTEDDRTLYAGFVSFDALWSPENPTKRRAVDITEDDINEQDILVIERTAGDTELSIIEAHSNDPSMGIILGSKAIKEMRSKYEEESVRTFEEVQRTLHIAGRMLKLSTF